MVNSLILANAIELLGGEGGVPSVIPACAGVVFLLADDGSYGLGAPQPTADYVASLLLDGERPFGRRSSNRAITLPIKIVAPPGAVNPLKLLAAAREVLGQAVDQDVFTITWTRDPGAGGTPLPLILDCYRAQPSKPAYNPLDEDAGLMRVTLTIPARPFGRSDTQVQVPFAAPIPSAPPPPPPPVVIDTFSAISSTKHFQSSQCVVGPRSCGWDPDDDRNHDPGGQNSTFLYSASLATTLNISGMTSLAMWLGFGSRYYWCLEYRGRIHGVSVTITLTDTSGNKLLFSRNHLRLPVSPNSQQPCFSRVTMPIPGSATFDYTAVSGYTIEVVNRNDRTRRLSWVTCYVDALTAYPPSQTTTPVVRGSQYVLYGLQGTARAEATLAFQQAPSAGTVVPVTATGIGNYTVPANTAYLKVEAIGAGGAGASLTTTGNGGGGGGGAYSRENVFPCAPGDVIPYNVGTGGTAGASPVDGQPTIFGPGPAGPLVVTANGGGSVPQNSATGDPGGAVSGNVVSYAGGTGRTASGSVGGGGGSSGGTASAGLTPTGTAATVFTTAGTFSGGSGWLCPAGVTQVYAECWGAGASGAVGSSSTNGAGGGGGEYAAGYVTVTPGNHYTYVVGAGGASVSTSGASGISGGLSSFAGDAVTITANPGLFGVSTWRGGGGNGGSGSAAAVHYSGGQGGSASPYSGSGGSSAGPGSVGNPGNGYGSSTAAPAGGGAGGAGSGAGSGPGTAGTQPGGGGGGIGGWSTPTGAGAPGQIRLNYPSGLGAPTSNGAAAVAGGGAGGAGGPSANTAGSAGSQPGGAGGGACSTGTAEAGGAGGAGKLIITPYTSAAFKNLIIHRPPLGALKTFTPLVPVGGGGDAPDGTHQYSIPQPLSGINADFAGTYTIYLISSSWNGSSARTITVTVTQYEYAGGPSYSVSTLPVTITPSQVTNGIVTAGVLTLPVKQVAADNSGGYYSVSVTDSNTNDRFYDAIFLDTQGQTIVINRPGVRVHQLLHRQSRPEPEPGAHPGQQCGTARCRERVRGLHHQRARDRDRAR